MLKENDLVSCEETMALEQRRAFLRLPLAGRRRIFSQQAKNAASHYALEQSVQEREAWQGGDIVEH